MYHSQQLDSPPDPSQPRRPWSPHEPEPYSRYPLQAPRRERSDADISLEVLDLADYASMLPQNRDNAHKTYSSQRGPHYPDYPATPPRSFSLASQSSFPLNAPSLVSGVSSTSHSRSPRLRTPPPLHRPFSLPLHSSPAPTSGSSHNYPWLVEPQPITDQDEEADISAFPEWSRNWYRSQKSTKTMINPYAPIPTFDPAQLPSSFDSFDGYHPTQPYSSTSDSHRNLLPWAPEDDGTDVRITPEMKEERMRMLEREFGRNSSKQNTWNHGSKVIGSVNAKGNIITLGPKKRIIVRWMQGVFALGAAVASLYSALILKPVGSPPPRGTISAYLLYILSVITVPLLLYMFVFRPCCCSGKRGRKASPGEPNGMMVLPVQGLSGADRKTKGKRKKKDEGAGNISVNLIVDPTMFNSLGRRDEEKDEEEEAESSSGPHGRRRRGLFEGLAMEEQWKVARGELKHLVFFDSALLSLWFAELIVIILGKRCPVGKFEGWCDGYNVATALAAFLGVSFGFSVFFGIKDLHLSKVSPRTRT